jgi:hypothetical protein
VQEQANTWQKYQLLGFLLSKISRKKRHYTDSVYIGERPTTTIRRTVQRWEYLRGCSLIEKEGRVVLMRREGRCCLQQANDDVVVL